MIKIALNGGMPKSQDPDVPATVDEYAEELRWFVSQGLEYFHIHFRDDEGNDTLEQSIVQPQFEALKAMFPGIQIGIGSPLLYGRTSGMRLEQISRWDGWKPDYISVNIPEEGCDELVELLNSKGVPMEIACFTIDDAYTFVEKDYIEKACRVLIEVSGEKDGAATVQKARNIYEYLNGRYPGVECVIHGEDIYTWDVIRWAKAKGHSWRIGMEDIDRDENGNKIATNRELYLHALEV